MDDVNRLKRAHQDHVDVLDVITCYERWNLETLATIRNLPLPVELQRALNIHVEPNAQRIRVNYTTCKGDSKGRVYGKIVYHSERYKKRKIERDGAYIYEADDHPSEEDTNGGDGLQRLSGWVRRLVAHEYYRDYDMCNCAPTLLQQILERVNLCPPELIAYNTERDTLFKKYAHIGTPSVIKRAFLVVLHMGGDNLRIPETGKLKWSLKAKLAALATLNDDYRATYERCEKACEQESKKAKKSYLRGNKEAMRATSLGKFCAVVWNREEHRVLMTMRDYFVEREGYDRRHMVLCFDGIMVEKKVPEGKPVDLAALSDYIEEQTSFRVKVEEKSMLPTDKDKAILRGEIPVVYKQKLNYA